MDRISLTGIDVYAHHGVHPAERELGQRFVIDLAVEADCGPAAAADDLNLALDYAALHACVRETATAGRYRLLETLALEICREVLTAFAAARVEVTVRKPHPPIPEFGGSAAVAVARDRRWLEGDGP